MINRAKFTKCSVITCLVKHHSTDLHEPADSIGTQYTCLHTNNHANAMHTTCPIQQALLPCSYKTDLVQNFEYNRILTITHTHK